MRPLATGPRDPADRGMFTRAERRRMISLISLFVMAVVVFVTALFKWKAAGGPAEPVPQAEEPISTRVATPPVDVERLRELARDATREQRVLIDTAALAEAFRSAALIQDAHFEPMGGKPLDAQALAELEADPAAHRGHLYRARGWIEELRTYPAAGSLPGHVRGRLRLENGRQSHFAALELPAGEGYVGDFVRLDGLFLENYSSEGDQGWVDAPLLVAPRAVTSYVELEPVLELPRDELATLSDDDPLEGLTGLPWDERWLLLSHALHVDESTIDWSQAPLLDMELMEKLALDGAPWRGQPIRIPPVVVQGITVRAAGENPLRLERLTEGWLGSWEWLKARHPVIRFFAPFDWRSVRLKNEVTARGFFLKNQSYVDAEGNPRVAPLFVLSSIQVLPPADKSAWLTILIAIGVSFVAFAALIAFLLVRDRRRSAELQDELLRRRRERRARAAH
jgi:hypothetical protein